MSSWQIKVVKEADDERNAWLGVNGRLVLQQSADIDYKIVFFKEGVQQMQIASLNLNVQLTDLNLLCSTLQLGASHSSRTDLGFIWIFYITRIPNRDTESTEKAFE